MKLTFSEKPPFKVISLGINDIITTINFDIVEKEEGVWECNSVTISTQGPATLDDIKRAVCDEINKQTDENIISGFVWNGINVWLSSENQSNFSEAQRAGQMNPERFLPVTFKLGESENGTPIYYQFESIEDLTDFYYSAQEYVRNCLAEGWKRKDSIDWSVYDVS